MSTMIVHDTRLKGQTPLNYNYVLVVNQTKSIHHILSVVANCARRQRKLSLLHIFCHGYEADWNMGQQICTPGAAGGFGLQLGREGLSLYNATQTTMWKGLIDRIVLFACAPADTGRGNEGTAGDGRRFCGELALWSGAEVIAARETQYYNTIQAHYRGGRTANNTIDFGAWEGPVYSFDPNSGQPRQITPQAYDMANPAVI
ncbi:MAG TPA: hypothetical protein VLJ17_03485 [Xanthobacteraceae bacterium]|nr:hypothetical protein [Xanthobacteraceae bacterium]